MILRRSLFLVILVVASQAFAGTASFTIRNNDAPNVGFNDPTPATPVGGNSGTTRGQQRLNVFLAAAEHWRKFLDTDVDVIISANFTRIPGCTATAAILGQAAPTLWKLNAPNTPRADVWYPIALANKYAGQDLEPNQADIFVQFNSDVDNSTCLGEANWYYGFDGNEGGHIDLYSVVLHELAHGFGIAGSTVAPDFLQNRPDAFSVHLLDRTAGVRWDQMTSAQRLASMRNTGNLVWDGPQVTAAAARYLAPSTTFTVTEPSEVAKNYDIGLATFGPPANVTALAGSVVQASDAANAEGPTTNDGCSAFTNAAAIAGKIALVDRGTCTFGTKARNAQAASATGLIIVDNRRTDCLPPSLGFDDIGSPEDIRIPVFSIIAADGDRVKAQLTAQVNVSGMLRVDPSQLSGASQEGNVRLYAPCTVEPGSSTHHFDTVAFPNLLMEPSINDDLKHDPDLTLHMLLDIGWTSRTGRRALTR